MSVPQADPSLANAEDTTEFGERYRPVHYAAYIGHLELCQLLVQHKANVRTPQAPHTLRQN